MSNRDDQLLRRTLEKNNRLLIQLIENTPAAIAMLDREMKYIIASRRFLIDYNLGTQSLIGRSHYEVFPEIPERLKEIHRRCLAGAIETGEEEPFPRSDGSLDWVHWEVHPWYEADGKIGGIIIFSEVITKIKQANERLREERDKFAKIVATSPGAICVFCRRPDDSAFFPYASPKIEDIYGFTPEQMAEDASSIGHRIHPDDLARVREEIYESAHTLSPWQSDYRYRHPKKGEVWIENRFLPSLQEDGGVLWYGLVLDVTDRRKAEEDTRKSNRIWKSTFDAISDIICVISRNYDFLKINAAGCKMLGLSEDQIIGRKCYELIHGTNAPIKDCPCYICMRSGEPSIREYEEKGCYFELGAWPLLNAAGNVESVTHIIRDITARKKQDIEYRQLIDGMNDTVYVVDPKAKFLDVNETAVHTLGYSRTELLSMGPKDIDPLFSSDEIMKFIEETQSVGRKVMETQHKTKDGKIIPVEISSSSVTYRGKAALLCIARDLTERKRAERKQEKLQAQFIQAQKMESVGRLAGGVAHDYNNILSVILGYTEMAMEKIAPEDSLNEDLKQIHAAAIRSRNITRQLLAFARKETIAPEVLDLNITVENMLKILRRLIGEDINLIWLPGTSVWPVLMDPTQIDQILANLCINARDAIENVGEITIETGKAVFDQTYCDHHAGLVPGDYVMLSVTDNGCGMDRETLDNIFEPFFTTKGVGKGTGLGLATVYGIIQQNNGHINVYSEPGQGSVFKIYLPRHRSAIAESQPKVVEKIPESKGETLLVIEDDISILSLVQIILRKHNYRILAANTPIEALQLAASHSDKIDLLITDVIMPGMSGHDLADRLQKLCPGLKCLYMSGYTADVIAHRGVLNQDIHFIQKPFSSKELAIKVRAVLDGI
jgi:two-component system, cell cycle sensor histidine kinase and response regulator CckA